MTKARDLASGGFGLVLVKPSSVVNGTDNGKGTVSFSAVSSVSVNGVFSSTYNNYLMMLTVDGNTDDCQLRIRMRNSGADESSAAYNFAYARARSTATSISTGGATNTSFFIGELESNFNGRAAYKIDFFSPKLLTKTRMAFNAIDSDSASNYASGAGGGVLNNDLAYDSTSIFPASGTFSGTISVYGYNN